MSYTHTYQVNLDWQRDRQGILYAQDLHQKLDVATPPPFPKGVEGTWSPEHLFTAAVSSCLMTTFLAIAENSKLEFESFSCAAEGILGQEEGKYKMTEIILKPELVIKREEDRAKAERVLQKAEAACLISNSINSKVLMQTSIQVGMLA
ncbi:MAG TPA: OsmC family protein [Cyclobacteriaceae bacterium]|nr:OsmC family protein [Cyclobacteriaceae bacterium]